MIPARETLLRIEKSAKRLKKTKYAVDLLDEFCAIIPYLCDASKNYLFRAGETVNGAVSLSEANKDILEKELMEFYGAVDAFAKGWLFPGADNREGEIADLVRGIAKLFAKDEKSLCRKAAAGFESVLDGLCAQHGTVFDPLTDMKGFYYYKKESLPVFIRMAVYGMAYDLDAVKAGASAKSARNVIEKLLLLSIIQEEENRKKLSIAEKSGLGRNDPCHCGSGKKYKNCCGR